VNVPDPTLLATMTAEEIARTLRLDGATIQQLSKTIAQNPRSTIEPSGVVSDAPGRRALEGLGAEREQQGITGGLTIEQTIGQGGMGIVRIATQRSLGRKVAVKTIRPEARTERATLHLLREAWVTGALEHPNIVPVYDLGLDDDGSPIIVLKKIEGVEWATVIANAEEVGKRFGAHDLLEHNLRILVQLCNAVSLAHTRGILHRDLKPENVMIGSFGEVYLVDWGIAVSLEEDPTGRMPYAKASGREVAGTPCYMAPEMLGMGDLSERTDVYLLGAILHEILTGAPPHQGTFAQIVASIVRAAPEYPPDVPPELAAIAKKAMSRDPVDRFASAEELRKRLEWYLRHRGSLGLSTEASARLARMKELVVAGAERDDVYRLFAEARFGFRQAIAASEDNEVARAGLRDAIETMVAYELERGTPDAASAALAELDKPPESLSLRVSQAREKAEKDRARFAELEAQHDVTTGRRTRVAAAAILGGIWILAPQLAAFLEPSFAHPDRGMYVWTVILGLAAAAVGRWGRESLSKTLLNRQVRAAVMVALGMQLALELGCILLGVPFASAIILHFIVFATCVAAFSAMVEKRLWPATAGYLVMFFVSAYAPALRWHAMTVGHAILVANIFAAWGSFTEDRPRAVGRRIVERHRLNRASRRPPADPESKP
jgi:hypothetical protein